MTPTSTDIAIAIVAACRETGEKPLDIEHGHKRLRARHYVVHAICYVFEDVTPLQACSWLGMPHSKQWWATSRQMIVDKTLKCGWWDYRAYARVIHAIESHRRKQAVAPLQQSDLTGLPDELIAELSPEVRALAPEKTVEVSSYVEAPNYPEPPKASVRPRLTERIGSQEPGTLKPSGYRPPKGTTDAILHDDRDTGPIFDRGRLSSGSRCPEPIRDSKAALREELRKAVENTAKAQRDAD